MKININTRIIITILSYFIIIGIFVYLFINRFINGNIHLTNLEYGLDNWILYVLILVLCAVPKLFSK